MVTFGRTNVVVADALVLPVNAFVIVTLLVADVLAMPEPTEAVSETEPLAPAVPFAGKVPSVYVMTCPACEMPVRLAGPAAVTPAGGALKVTAGPARVALLFVSLTCVPTPLASMYAVAVAVVVRPAIVTVGLVT